MSVCPDTEYVNRKYYSHSYDEGDSESLNGHQVCLSSVTIFVNLRTSRNPFHRDAGCTIDLCGQEISHLMPIPKLPVASSLLSSKLFAGPSLASLTHLKLAYNDLHSIPENIDVLEHLVHLDISHNRIQTLPRSLGSLSSLTVLQARNNLLDELPQEIGHLSSLSVLDVSQNNITVLPAELLRLANLCHLITTACPFITRVPKTTTRCPLSLRETCAKTIVRHHIPLHRELPIHLINYIASANECSVCAKPCYEGSIRRHKLHDRAGQIIPVQYTLCRDHWRDENELLLAMFSTTNSPDLHRFKADNDVSYQDSNAQLIAVEPVSTNHRASLVSPLAPPSTQPKRTIWRRTTAKFLNRSVLA